MSRFLSIIMPVLDDAALLGASLGQLQALRAIGHEVVVSDGGSRDRSLDIARPLSDIVLSSSRSRASRLNAGAYHAKNDILLFLLPHMALPARAAEMISAGLARSERAWGGFALHFWRAPLLGLWRSVHSATTGNYRLDQAVFMRRATFETLEGFNEQPVLEDVEAIDRLRKISPPLNLFARVRTLRAADEWHIYRRERALIKAWRAGTNAYDLMTRFDLPQD
jgi:glycosyltransferase involved in cell wall biosynthesis